MEYNLSTACLIAKEIIEKVPALYSPNSMLGNAPENYYLKDTDLLYDLAIKSVREGNLGNPNAIVKLIEHQKLDLCLVGGYAEFSERKPPEYLIVINGRHNICWRRFATIKEICSLYVNHYAREKNHGLELKIVQNYLASLTSSYTQKENYNNGSLNKSDLDSDTFAIVLATELMIPPPYRKYTSNLKDHLGSGKLTLNDIAKSLLIPEHILKIHFDYFYDDSSAFYQKSTATSSLSEVV